MQVYKYYNKLYRQKEQQGLFFFKSTLVHRGSPSILHQNIKKIPFIFFLVVKKLFHYSSLWCFKGLVYYHFALRKSSTKHTVQAKATQITAEQLFQYIRITEDAHHNIYLSIIQVALKTHA